MNAGLAFGLGMIAGVGGVCAVAYVEGYLSERWRQHRDRR